VVLIAHHDGEPLTMLENKRATYEMITMNYRQKVQRLTRLQDMDPDLLLKEIDQPWPGMEADMEVALAVMRTCHLASISLKEHSRVVAGAGKIASA
jgi:hypothetical protein